MWRASRASLLAASVLAMGACGDGGGGNTGPSGVPTRIVFQYAGSGGVFDDNVPVTPGPQTVSASITGGISVVFTATVS